MSSMATSPPKKNQKKRPLNIRERKLIKALMAGQPPTTAMRTAGYTKETADRKAGEKVRDSRIQETIQELLEKKGLSDDKIVDVLAEGLEATKVISANIIAKSGEGMADANSMTKDFIDVVDFKERRESATVFLKLKGHLRDKLDVEHSGNITVIFEDPFGQTDKS